MTPDHPLLVTERLAKAYATPVLSDVRFELRAGKVHALVGENGAGKSTFSKIVCGIVQPSAGDMRLAGRMYAPVSRTDAERQGVRMVMQELNLVPTLSVAENLLLGQLPNRFGFVSRTAMHEAARERMAQVGLDAVDPAALVGTLGIGHQQMIEIARALIGECRLLILDEPTAMLTEREVDLLFAQIDRLKAQGVGIIYISHRLEEVKQIAHRVSVLRDGRLVESAEADTLSSEAIVRLMAGRELGDRIDLGRRTIGAPVLRASGLSRGKAVQDVSFELRAGEILGFAGLIGSGRTELLRLIYGADRKDHGELQVGDEAKPARIRSPREAVAHGIAMITEDRKGQGLLLPQPISVNTTLAWPASVSRGGWIRFAAEHEIAQRYVERLATRCQSVLQPVVELSGGTQQKVVLARWLHRDCRVMLFDEPTRGIDVGTKFEIYTLLGELARQGKGIVFVSSDLRELMLVCDRIAVMSAGRLVRTFTRDAWSQDAILGAAFSGYVNQTPRAAAVA